MKRALQMWMERVMYARDPLFNQAFRQIADVVLTQEPVIPVRTEGHVIDDKIEILGIGTATGAPIRPGVKTDVHVYFRVREPTPVPYRFSLVVWPATPATTLTDPTDRALPRGPSRPTADGAFAADRWQKGDRIRERFPFVMPADWTHGAVVGLVVTNPKTGERVKPTGATPANDAMIHSLGVLPAGSQGTPSP
jgi:hypothetical protein